jgi:hypothetical protein
MSHTDSRAQRLCAINAYDPDYLKILERFSGQPATKASHRQDYQEATDFILSTGARVAVKTRSNKWLLQQPNEFALRGKNSSYPSEYQKIISGEYPVKYLLQTYLDTEGENLVSAKIIDIGVVILAQRDWYSRCKPPTFINDPSRDVHLVCFDEESLAHYGAILLARFRKLDGTT